MADDSSEQGAFAFTGDWREFAPIAFTNLLLSIVTLGIYLFWARARERRYLWSRTRFIDDRLEWTGTGLELLIGYVLAFFLIVLPLGLLQFGLQALVLRGHPGAAAALFVGLYLLLLYFVGIAISARSVTGSAAPSGTAFAAAVIRKDWPMAGRICGEPCWGRSRWVLPCRGR